MEEVSIRRSRRKCVPDRQLIRVRSMDPLVTNCLIARYRHVPARHLIGTLFDTIHISPP